MKQPILRPWVWLVILLPQLDAEAVQWPEAGEYRWDIFFAGTHANGLCV